MNSVPPLGPVATYLGKTGQKRVSVYARLQSKRKFDLSSLRHGSKRSGDLFFIVAISPSEFSIRAHANNEKKKRST